MPILDTALAFALTMLVVAMVVAQIVRFLRNTVKLRNAELRKMLKEFFGKQLQPVVDWEVRRQKKNISDGLYKEVENLGESELSKQDELDTRVEVSIDEVTGWLKQSEFGQKLLTELGDKVKDVFDELGRRYEIVGDKFTESFRKHSRRWATFVALILALVVNIDSIHIVNSYIKNEGMRQGVIAQRDAFVEDYSALVKSLEKDKGKESVTKEEVEQAFSDSNEKLKVLTSAGFPVGWSYFPHSGLQDGESKDFQRRNNMGGWVMWILGILLTALLAGFGTPFWYDTVTGISRVVQKARAVKKPAA